MTVDFVEVKWNETHYSESPLPSHPCSEEELGLSLEKSNGKYMKPHPYHEPFIRKYKKKFLCLNEEDRYLQGSFDTSKTRNVRVRLNRCRSEV